MADKLVTVAIFVEPVEANLAKGRIEAEGIECFLAGEHFAGTYWLLSNAAGGVKLQVRESDAQRAAEILQAKAEKGSAETDDTWVEQDSGERCPKCHSDDIEYEPFSRKVFYLSILLLRFPLLFIKRRYTCRACGHVWK